MFLKLLEICSGATKNCGKRNKRKKDAETESVHSKSSTDEEDDNKKKMRTTFTGKQIFELEKSFESKKYLSSAERADMAASLKVTQQQVGRGEGVGGVSAGCFFPMDSRGK